MTRFNGQGLHWNGPVPKNDRECVTHEEVTRPFMIPVRRRQEVRTELLKATERGGDGALFLVVVKENDHVDQSTYCCGVVIERRLDGGVFSPAALLGGHGGGGGGGGPRTSGFHGEQLSQ